MEHTISGSIVEQCDCCVLAFMDTSEYMDTVETTNPVLQIYPPNWNSYVNIPYNINGITLIRSKHLKIGSIPSGLYHFKQSVCPNEETEVSSCYLNICPEIKKIENAACLHQDDEEKLEELYDLKMDLEIAQGMVNNSNCDTEKAIKLFNDAVKDIDKLNNEDCV